MQRSNITPACPRHAPRSEWRTCDTCARNRSARIADITEDILKHWPSVAWVTLTPDDYGKSTVDSIRAAYLRALPDASGVWTVERGEQAGKLHANILTQHHRVPRIKGAQVHLAPVVGALRNVAAYISKRSQIPDMRHHSGRLFGRFGTVGQWLLAPESPPVVRAAAIEKNILRNWGPLGLADPRWLTKTPEQHEHEEGIERARRHLPKLMAVHQEAMRRYEEEQRAKRARECSN